MTQIIEEEKEQNKQPKPRVYKTAMNVDFELAGGALTVFKELLKTYKESISDNELPMEIHADNMLIRAMDAARIKMANFNLSKRMFEEWHVENRTRYKSAPLPIRIKVPIEDVIYAIENAGKEAKAKFEISTVFNTKGEWTKVAVRKPEKCPKCGVYTTNNQLPPEKRGKKGNRYKCVCGWKGKVRKWERKERVMVKELGDESTMKIEVTERTKETYKVTIFKDEEPEIPPLPIIPLNAQFKLVAKDFKAILERMRKRTDHFTMVSSDKGLALSGRDDLIEMDIKIERGSDILIDVDARPSEKAIYALDQVLSILPKPSVAEVISIKYSTDMPLLLTWFISQLGADCLVDFYVAPRIEVEG